MLHWRGSAQAPLCVSEADGGIAFLRRAVQYVGDAMQSLRHGFAVPPPFAQGRLWLSANRICSVNPNFSQTSAAPKASPVQGEVARRAGGVVCRQSVPTTTPQSRLVPCQHPYPLCRFATSPLDKGSRPLTQGSLGWALPRQYITSTNPNFPVCCGNTDYKKKWRKPHETQANPAAGTQRPAFPGTVPDPAADDCTGGGCTGNVE